MGWLKFAVLLNIIFFNCTTSIYSLDTETLAMKTASGRPVRVASARAFVLINSNVMTDQMKNIFRGLSITDIQDKGNGWFLIGWSKDSSPVAKRLEELKNVPGIVKTAPSLAYRALKIPNDPFFSTQYALAQVNAPGAWEFEVGNSSKVTIAVVDAGIDGSHSDLSQKLSNTTSMFFNPNIISAGVVDNPPTPACDHGTHVAGVAGAVTDNGSMVSGMSWGAQLVSYKIFNTCSSSDCSDIACQTDDNGVISAINHAISLQNTAAYGHFVINLSIGTSPAVPCSAPLQTAITNAVNAGIVIVAAAGNDGSDVNPPGNCAGVIPMGATGSNNQIASFSSRGPELASSGLVAPGVSVLTTQVGDTTTNATGTSFSTPMGAGLAALILSARPTSTPAQVQTYMRAGAEDLGQSSQVQGAGRMNAYRSLALAVRGTLSDLDGESKPISFPNPFRVSQSPYVSFSFPPSLQGDGAKIKIYTNDGTFIREINGLIWNGKNTDGNLVASGTYVFVVSTNKGSARGRLTLIR